MNSIVIVIIAALFLVIGYGVYGRFMAYKVLMLNKNNVVPSETLNDGHDYVPTNKVVLMGHHFAAIAGAGPLIGPVLAAQYGFLPGVLWILIGSLFIQYHYPILFLIFLAILHRGLASFVR